MADVEITRKKIIVVGEVGQNSYGDLTFTDKEGKEYKVGTKRRQYFDDVILPDRAVQLNYAKYKGREYIYNADQVEDILLSKALAGKPPTARTQPEIPSDQKETPKPLTKDEQIERAVWIKELGECIRSRDIDKTTPLGKALRDAYYAEMCRVLGINIKEVTSAKSLIEEAKKLGAKEIRKEDD